MRDFEIALGQYILYRNLISLTEPEYQIYLAIKDINNWKGLKGMDKGHWRQNARRLFFR